MEATVIPVIFPDIAFGSDSVIFRTRSANNSVPLFSLPHS